MSDALRIAHGAFGRVALLNMDAPLVRHAHPHCHVLIKAEGADTRFVVRDRLVPLTRDDAVLINAWEPHHYAHDPACAPTIILALYIKPEWLSQFRRNWIISGAPGFFRHPCVVLPSHIRRLADAMAEALADGAETQSRREAQLSTLMIAIIEQFTESPQACPSLRDLARATCTDYRIRRAIAAMRDDPARASDIGGLARSSGLSRAHFFRLFERAVHVPPRVFVNVLRLEDAVGELVSGTASIATLSERLGFSAPAHFTRFFRGHAGASPGAFRAVARTG